MEGTMRVVPNLLLRIVCSLALVLSAWPARAGVVCVAEGRIVARCGMADLPPADRADCPKPCCGVHADRMAGAVHCELLYRAPAALVRDAKAKPLPVAPALVLAPPVSTPPVLGWIVEAEAPPRRERPCPATRGYVPDRGRAPPHRESATLVNDSNR